MTQSRELHAKSRDAPRVTALMVFLMVNGTRVLPAIVVCALLIAACNTRSSTPARPTIGFRDLFDSVRTTTLSPPPVASVRQGVDLLVDGDRVIVVDAAASNLKVFSRSTGAFRYVIGAPGDLAGDFRQPVSIAPVESGGFVVLDGLRKILSFRAPTGSDASDVSIPGVWVELTTDPLDSSLIISGRDALLRNRPDANNQLHEFNFRGHLVRSFFPAEKLASRWATTFNYAFVGMEGQYILAGTFNSNIVHVFDRRGTPISSFPVAPGWFKSLDWPPDGPPPPGETGANEGAKWLKSHTIMAGIVPIANGRFLTRFESYSVAGEKLYNYALATVQGVTVAVTQASRARITRSAGDTVYWLEPGPNGRYEFGTAVVKTPSSLPVTSKIH